MAQRVLTSEEKQALQLDPTFTSQAQWALRDYASYWATHDGAGLSTESARLKWAKDRQNSVALLLNDFIANDNQLGLKICKLAKGIQVDLGVAPVTSTSIVIAFIAGNKFEELASLYFDQLGEGINMSVTGN